MAWKVSLILWLLNTYRVVLYARIKIQKAYLLHDQGNDEEAMKEADDAEVMLSLGECHEDMAEGPLCKSKYYLVY